MIYSLTFSSTKLTVNAEGFWILKNTLSETGCYRRLYNMIYPAVYSRAGGNYIFVFIQKQEVIK